MLTICSSCSLSSFAVVSSCCTRSWPYCCSTTCSSATCALSQVACSRTAACAACSSCRLFCSSLISVVCSCNQSQMGTFYVLNHNDMNGRADTTHRPPRVAGAPADKGAAAQSTYNLQLPRRLGASPRLCGNCIRWVPSQSPTSRTLHARLHISMLLCRCRSFNHFMCPNKALNCTPTLQYSCHPDISKDTDCASAKEAT